MENAQTVRVFPVSAHPGAWWLQWEAEVNPDHVPSAFAKLTAALDAAASPVHVLVDLRKDPVLPLTITIHEAMTGPLEHPRMGHWLVIGKNWRAQVIAGVITKTGIRKNIHWFETEEEALNHLSKLEMAAPAKETVA